MCTVYPGLSLQVLGDKFTYEAYVGLWLNLERCRNTLGAQVYKSMFYLGLKRPYIDSTITDALATDEDQSVMVESHFKLLGRNGWNGQP